MRQASAVAGLQVLIIGLNYAPEPVGIGPYTRDLAEALARRGARVQVIAGQPYYPHWRHFAGARRGWQTTDKGGVTVTRCPHYVPARPRGLNRIVHLASFALSALPVALAALRRRATRPALVLAIAPALPALVPAWLAARLAGARLWIHVQDFEVEAALATGLLGGGPLATLARWLTGALLRRGDAVSSISPAMCARLLDYGVRPERVLELRNWADPAFAPDPAGAAALRAHWGLGQRIVALYSGNLARKQGLDTVIAAARLLRERADIALVICGNGPERAALEQAAADLPNLQLHDLQPAARMGALLALADLHLLPQIAGAADLVLPSKLTNMLASGRPVIATAMPGTGLAEEVAGCGAVTAPGDPAALARAIAALADDPARCAALGAAARLRAGERWQRDAIIDRALATLADKRFSRAAPPRA